MNAETITAPIFAERLANRHRPLVAAHRGSCGGNIVHNTINAFLAAIRLGADIIECDVAKTRDGKLVLFHRTSMSWNWATSLPRGHGGPYSTSTAAGTIGIW
jgi:glycerophosphoryl diester phosphodiesterase